MSKNHQPHHAGGQLPSLKSPQHSSNPKHSGHLHVVDGTSPPGQSERYPRGPSRVDYLEDRLQQQERTTHALLERAIKVKEDIVDNLNYTHGTWQEEKRNRELLQDHIRTITDVVKKLDREIKDMEQQIHEKATTTTGTATAIKNLEMHHVAGLTDLRGRVARCDAAIARLSSDIKTCYDSFKVSSQQQQETHSKILDKLQTLETRMESINSQVQQKSTEQIMKMKHIEGDSETQLSKLDTKTRALVEEIRSQVTVMRLTEGAEREKLETKLFSQLERNTTVKENKLDQLNSRIDDWLTSMDSRMRRMEEQKVNEKDREANLQQIFDNKLHHVLNSELKKHTNEIARLKHECREGFSAVHESIGHMRTVTDGKRKLLEEQLRKEIGQIRKMVVLI